MTLGESEPKADFGELFEKRTREVFSSESSRARVGELAYENYKKCFGCSQSIFQAFQDVLELKDDFWFKAIGGLQGGGHCGLTCGWFDMNDVVNHYLGPRGPETIEKCAKLTGTTAFKVAEILSQL